MINMNITNVGVGRCVRQSYEYIIYDSGKTRESILTGILCTQGKIANVIARIGCFDDSTDKTIVAGPGNGHFFQLKSSNLYVVQRNNNVDTEVLQSN